MYMTSNLILNSNTISVAYIRVSDERQNEDFQILKAKMYAKNNNLTLHDYNILTEEKPASTDINTPIVTDLSVVFKHRPKLLNILLMASKHKFSHLIVYSSDRLAVMFFKML